MRIGIDIDETIVDTGLSFNRITGLNIKYSKIWSKDIINLFYRNIDEIFKNVTIKNNAKEVINSLAINNEIIIITARNNNYSHNVIDITNDFIKKSNLNISSIYYNQRKKSNLAKKLKIDIMIDDDIIVKKNMDKENIKCILFGKDAKDWMDVKRIIEGGHNG